MIYSSKKIIASFLFLFMLKAGINNLNGQANFAFTQPLEKAYQKTLSLRITESKNLLTNLKETDPNNSLIVLIEDYNDFFTILIREEYNLYRQKLENKEIRLRQIKRSDSSSPYYLYAQADIRLHWALLALRFEEYYKAFIEVNKAFKLLKLNIKKFPDFMPNYKDIGILHAAVGTIPDNYRTGVELLTSLEGTIEQGKKEITQVLAYAEKNDFPFEAETKILFAFLLLHLENEAESAWQLINTDDMNPQSNPLHCFVVANIAMRTGHNELALKLLNNRPRSRAFLPMPFLDFMLGLTKLRRLDTDAAPYFQSFLSQFKGRHYIKEAYQKLAWCELLNGNISGYTKYLYACTQHGYNSAGGDKNATQEAESKTPPKPVLLKVRLLFDGAYYKKALHLLDEHPVSSFSEQKDQLEYTYRKGRVLHGLKRYNEAIKAYEKTIAEGKSSPYYFACNAALKMGEIYERQMRYDKSKQAYRLCLSIDPDEYRTGLHQQAKAGLNRLK